MGVSISWKSRAVQTAGFGLAKAGDRPHTPRQVVTEDQLIQLALSNGWRNELSNLALLSWTFLLRAPSQRLPLCRRRTGGVRVRATAWIGGRRSGYPREGLLFS